MFAVGDLAVYPAHGVGLIERIEHKQMDGKTYDFYVMRILDNDMKIMIPKSSQNNVGLRPLIKEDEIEKVYEILKKQEIEIDSTKTWNKRYREYMDRIKTGSIYDLAVVIRDMYLKKREKSLSFGEKRMLENALALLVKEIAITRKVPESQVLQEIESFFAQRID